MSDLGSPTFKICGLRDVATAMVASEAGATALGFMLAPSRRQVQPSDVRSILRQLPAQRPVAVGVVVNESPHAIAELVDETDLDIIQLSGDETPAALDQIAVTTWKALRFPPETTLDEARQTIEPWLTHVHPVQAILLDAAVPGTYGGSGHLANWPLARLLAQSYPIVLAGGLTPGNIAEAIHEVHPAGVDVSSGVEIDRVKSPDRIREFLANALGAYGISTI